MGMTDMKARLRGGQKLLGTMVTTFADADMPKLLRQAGFDFFMLDCEHGSFTTREAANMIAVARGIGFPALVRIPELRREHVLHFLEMGASGLMLPSTETAQQARTLVDYAKYAPLGHRGVSLSRPHTDFEKVDGRSYMDSANENGLLLCQIESRLGLRNIEEILAVEGVDGAMMGPNDLSQDCGKLGQFGDGEIVAGFNRVLAAAKANGKFSGAHFGGLAPLLPWIQAGMELNMWNSDIGLLAAGAAAGLTQLRDAGK